jgi:hypothetical protein
MGNKSESSLSFFLTIWFATVLVVLSLIAGYFKSCVKKPGRTYKMETLPNFDMDGNVYVVKREYDHLPTKEDSINFNNESRIEISKMIDSIKDKNK